MMRCFILLMTLFTFSMLIGCARSDEKATKVDSATENSATGSRVLKGHTGRIWSMAIGTEGRWLVTGGRPQMKLGTGIEDKTAFLWDLKSKNSADSRELKGHTSWITSTAISPDGRWLVTGSNDKTARLWDLKSKNPAGGSRVLKGHTGSIHCVAISPDSRWLVTGCSDKTARLWDLKSENPAVGSHELKGHADYVYCVAISPDGRWLVTGSFDKTARVWDLKRR